MDELLCYVAGDWTPASQAAVPLFDSSVMFGEMVTETLRTFRRRPYRTQDHLVRMRLSMSLADIRGPSADDLAGLVDELLARNADAFDPSDEILVKIDVSRGTYGYYRTPGTHYEDCRVFLHPVCLPFHKFARSYTIGAHAAFPLTRQVPAQSIDPRVKHRSRLYQGIAERQVDQIAPGAMCLMLDIEGRVAEGTGWNLFIVKNGALFTPRTDNCLAGISRQVVIELCEAMGFACTETTLWPYDIATADEAFATATSFCLLPLTTVHHRVVGDGEVGPVTQRLLERWGAEVGMDIVQQAEEVGRRQSMASDPRAVAPQALR
jgi:branched-chain amino acid aminotransferase